MMTYELYFPQSVKINRCVVLLDFYCSRSGLDHHPEHCFSDVAWRIGQVRDQHKSFGIFLALFSILFQESTTIPFKYKK